MQSRIRMRSNSASSQPDQGDTGSFQGWYALRKKRAMAKLEIGDAFAMRGRVAVALIAYTILGMWAFVYAVRRAYIWLMA